MTYYSKTPNTLGIRNNNPFNIRFSKRITWLGQTGQNETFCTFSNIEYGVRAGVKLLKNYITSNHRIYGYRNTISKIIYSYAPITENETERYISYLCKNLGITRSTVLEYNTPLFWSLCCLIMFYESQYKVPEMHITYIINKFKI